MVGRGSARAVGRDVIRTTAPPAPGHASRLGRSLALPLRLCPTLRLAPTLDVCRILPRSGLTEQPRPSGLGKLHRNPPLQLKGRPTGTSENEDHAIHVERTSIGVGAKEIFAPPSEPDGPISGIRLSSWWLTFKKIGMPQCALALRRTSQPRRSRY